MPKRSRKCRAKSGAAKKRARAETGANKAAATLDAEDKDVPISEQPSTTKTKTTKITDDPAGSPAPARKWWEQPDTTGPTQKAWLNVIQAQVLYWAMTAPASVVAGKVAGTSVEGAAEMASTASPLLPPTPPATEALLSLSIAAPSTRDGDGMELDAAREELDDAHLPAGDTDGCDADMRPVYDELMKSPPPASGAFPCARFLWEDEDMLVL